MKMVLVARKLSTIDEQRKEQNCFGEGITGTKVTNPKNILGSSSVEDGFKDNFSVIFNDTYRMIRPMLSFRAIKIDKKRKHLTN
jgi:hypothetical protein